MMKEDRTIWKYVLKEHKQTIEMPAGAVVLTVQIQGNNLVMWAMVNPNAEKVKRKFAIHMTGQKMPRISKSSYIGTVQSDFLVWHVFEG